MLASTSRMLACAAIAAFAFVPHPSLAQHGGHGGGWHGGGSWHGGGGGWHGGGWHGGHSSVGVYVGPGWGWGWGWYGYPYYWGYPYSWGYPYYPYYSGYPYGYRYPYSYYDSPYAAYPPAASVPYVERSPGAAVYWYYCKSPAGYYPYVKSCSERWMKVLPQDVPAAPNASPPPASSGSLG